MQPTKEDQEIIIALKKAHTQLGNVIKMIDQNIYCIDVLQQSLSVIGLLKSANSKIMKRHLHSCFTVAMKSSNDNAKRKMIDEILKINTMINK